MRERLGGKEREESNTYSREGNDMSCLFWGKMAMYR